MIANLVNWRWTHPDPDVSRALRSDWCRLIRVTETAGVAFKNAWEREPNATVIVYEEYW